MVLHIVMGHCLHVTELDAIKVEHTLRVGQDESIQGQDLEHLQRRHQGAAPLPDHMTDCTNTEQGFYMDTTYHNIAVERLYIHTY